MSKVDAAARAVHRRAVWQFWGAFCLYLMRNTKAKRKKADMVEVHYIDPKPEPDSDQFPAAAIETYPEQVDVPAVQRFNEVRQKMLDLLNRSFWDQNAQRDIWTQLGTICPRMTATCRRLIKESE